MTGWMRLLDAAEAPTAALRAALRDPEAAQLALLRRILTSNAATEFGQAHAFDRLTSLDAYRAHVPVAAYENVSPYIDHIAAGEANVLTRDPVIAFEETGGTTSGGKLIPYTEESLAGFRAAVLPWLVDLVRRRPGVTSGSTYVSISPVLRQPRRTSGGIPIGLGSDTAYLGDDLVDPFLSILAVSPEVAGISDVDAWRIATIARLVEREDLTFVSVWSPTFFLHLIEALPLLAGTVALALRAPAAARLDRAMRLSPLHATLLWPKLDTISCWSDAGSAIFARRLASLCPQARIEPKGLLATEAAITLPWTGNPGAIPALTSTFIEFIDTDDTPWLAHELHSGTSYRVVITTTGGLYRYAMGDQVRCIGFDGGAPRLIFEGRTALVSDLVGEKLTEAFVAGILASLPAAAALVPRTEPTAHYELWLDSEERVLEGTGARIDTELRANPQYAYARDIGQLGPIRVFNQPGFVARRQQDFAAVSRRIGDFKPVALLPDSPSRWLALSSSRALGCPG